MRLRLHGTPAEVTQAAARLGSVFTVVSVSRPYPDRGASTLVRVYVEVGPLTAPTTLAPAAPPPSGTPTQPDPAAPSSPPAPPSVIPLEVQGGGSK